MKSADSEKNSRQKLVKVLADKVANMPPESAIGMLVNWPDGDIIDALFRWIKTRKKTEDLTIYYLSLKLFFLQIDAL